uniref:Ima1 N-terminal domain-containing protein n=1 Tax=Anopheles culicifacies TaxID=139723 RepID=A0A182M4S1_9DIPT
MGANLLVLVGTIVVPLVVICFVAVVTFVNLYLNIRRRFPVKVNCWFCNHDTRVPYDDSNSFVCPACKQYNGFTADGDYNREIPEQYQQRLNNYHFHHPSNITDDDKWDSSTVRSSIGNGRFLNNNGLCFGCNRNQELKIHQLASFVPEDEDNYDAEVEEYSKQLEQAYKLCGRCERVLKRTLNDVKRNILGSKLAQIGSKSMDVLDMHIRASTKHLAHLKRQRWAKVCAWSITALLLVKLQQSFVDSGWTVADLLWLCPAPLLSGITMFLSYVLAMREVICQQFEKLLLEPSVQQTTVRIEAIGYDIFLQYVPNSVVQSSAHYYETITAQVPHERSSSLLLNAAIAALAALLASLGSQRTIAKQLLIAALCLADCTLQYAEVKDSSLASLLLTTGALVISLSSIGQRLIRSDVPTTNLNSSFHKIYSQQCKESDYSDVDTSNNVPELSSLRTDQNTFGNRSPPVYGRSAKQHVGGDMSGKSLDTTVSGSPSGFSLSPTNPFLTVDGSPPLGFNKIGSSLFNVATAVDQNGGIADKASAYDGKSITSNASAHSLLKTPSFSVDNFRTLSHDIAHRQSARRSGPTSMDAGRQRNFNQFRYSMSTINQEEDRPFHEEEDQLIEDDIDRLSISGRVSLNASGMLGSRTSLAGTINPFAKKTHPETEYDELTMRPTSLHHRTGIFRAPEPSKGFAKDTLWTGGSFGGQLTHMSRTSSQSSGFESQTGTTRRNTPTEVDGCANVETRSDESQHILSLPRSEQPSPVPSSASVFEWASMPRAPYDTRSKTSQQRSLFSEQNLFNSALQQANPNPLDTKTATVPPTFTTEATGLFFPKHTRTPSASNGGSISVGSTASARHIFPPQQSQTPSYHPKFSHIPPGMGTGWDNFGTTASFASKAPSLASLASTYTSNKPTASGRASLLNVSKFATEQIYPLPKRGRVRETS